MLFVCSPNNPTGNVESRDTIERLIDLAEDARALLVVDEAYGEFAPWSALELVDDARPLVVARTYSKVWSLAAVRLGFAVGPAWVIEELEKVGLPYTLSVPTQLAGTIALDFGAEIAPVGWRAWSRNGAGSSRALADRPDLEVFPSGANFLLVRVTGDAHGPVGSVCSREACSCATSRRWPRVEECLRVTVGTPAENDAFLAALGEALPEAN